MARASSSGPDLDALVRDYLAGLEEARAFARRIALAEAARGAAGGAALPEIVASPDWGALASDRSAALVAGLAAASGEMDWIVPYGGDPAAGRGVAERSAYTTRIGPQAPRRSANVAAGFFVVGAGVEYVDHCHAPEELYLPVAGRAEFWAEGTGWRAAGPDTVLVHRPWQWHAMRTGDEPVLILWAWLGPEALGVTPTLRPTLAGLPAGPGNG